MNEIYAIHIHLNQLKFSQVSETLKFFVGMYRQKNTLTSAIHRLFRFPFIFYHSIYFVKRLINWNLRARVLSFPEMPLLKF